MTATGMILDVLLAALVALGVWRGARKGLVLTLCGLLAVIVAYLGAAYVTAQFAEGMGAILQPAVEERLDGLLTETMGDAPLTGSDGTAATADTLTVQQILQVLEGNRVFAFFAGALAEDLHDGLAQAADTALERVSAAIAREAARLILFSAAFLLILLAWTLVSHILDLACRLPVLHTLNGLGGGLLGGAKALLILFALGWVVSLLGLLTPADVESTLVAKYFIRF